MRETHAGRLLDLAKALNDVSMVTDISLLREAVNGAVRALKMEVLREGEYNDKTCISVHVDNEEVARLSTYDIAEYEFLPNKVYWLHITTQMIPSVKVTVAADGALYCESIGHQIEDCLTAEALSRYMCNEIYPLKR